MPLFIRPSCYRSVGAFVVAVVALAASGPDLAAHERAGMLGLDPVLGTLDEVCFYSELGFAPSDPLSALALSGGDSLLVLWEQGGSGPGRAARRLFWLSPEGSTLRAVGFDVPPGRVSGAVRLLDNRVLVTAEEGIFLFDEDRRLKRIADCDQTGLAQIIRRADGNALTLSNGDVLLRAQRGLLRLSPQGRQEPLGELPPGTGAVQMLEDDTVLVSGVFGHYLLNRDGQATPVATGLLARATISARDAKAEMRSMPSQDEAVAREMGVPNPPPPNGLARIDANGRARWAKLPDDVTMVSPLELEDGGIFLLSDRGLLRLRDDGTMQSVSAAVRLSCADAEQGGIPLLETLADGRTLVLARGGIFTIDRKDRVEVLSGAFSCTERIDEDDVAATTDGQIYFVKDDALHSADPDGRVVVVAGADDTGTIYSLESVGADLLVEAQKGVFHSGRGRPFERVMPMGHDLELPYTVADLDGRPLVCVDKNALHRLDSRGILQPLPSVAGIPCWRVESAGTIGLLMEGRDRESKVIVTRDDRVIVVPGARVWPVAQLQDGSAILLTMPAGRHEAMSRFDPDEQAKVPHSLIRVSPQGRVEPVAFEGPEIDLKPPADLTWLERLQVRAIQFSNPTRGWAIFGDRGVLAMTDDAGANWGGVLADGGPLEGLASLSFTADGRHGMAAGKEFVWRTDDAGATWKQIRWSMKVHEVQQVRLLEREGSRAYAIVERVVEKRIKTDLLVSNDGGQTWESQALPLPAMAAHDMSGMGFDSSGLNGWLVADDRFLTTGNGGNSWQVFADLRDFREIEASRWRFEMPRLTMMFGKNTVLHLPTMPVAIAYWAPDASWCISRGKLFCTVPEGTAGRVNSQEVATDADVIIAAMTAVGDAKHAWAVGTDGLILATEDGGKMWAAQTSGVRRTIAGVFFLSDALHGWVWGDDGMRMTSDGGKNWQPILSR